MTDIDTAPLNGLSRHGADGRLPTYYSNLHEAEATAWRMLTAAVSERRSAFHQATLATVDDAGLPSARTVVLREVDTPAHMLRFNTDVRSRKFSELLRQEGCMLHFYDRDAKVQIRASGSARLHHLDQRAADVWQAMRAMSRACYHQPAAPGDVLLLPEAVDANGPLTDDEAFANMAAVEVQVEEMEWLYLAAVGHRRARFCYRDAPTRVWLAP